MTEQVTQQDFEAAVAAAAQAYREWVRQFMLAVSERAEAYMDSWGAALGEFVESYTRECEAARDARESGEAS